MGQVSRIISLAMLVGIFLLFFGCGGGGGGTTTASTPSTNTDPTTPGGSTVAIAGFDFTLKAGDFWEYTWVYSESTTSSSGTSGDSDVGNFRIVLGAPQVIDGKSAFPVTITGKRTDPAGFTYAANLTHIALVGNQLLVSTDGTNLKVIFDANTAKGTGDFFASLGVVAATNIVSVTMDNQFVKNTTAYRVGGSTDDPLCDQILGQTVCGDQATSISEYEYYKAGIGPVSYYLLTTNTFTGGGYTTYHRTEKTLGLVDSSLSSSDGYNPAGYPWRVKAEIPITNFDSWFAGGAVLNGKIYVVYNGELQIYDPAGDSWTPGPNLGVTGAAVALAYGGKLYLFRGQDIYQFDPTGSTWSKLPEVFAFNRALQQYAVGMLNESNVPRYGVFYDTGSSAIYFYDFQAGSHVLWSTSNFPGTGEDFRSLAVYGDQLYSFGGSYGYQDTWGWVTNYFAHSYRIDPYSASPAWVALANLPTARSGAMAVVDGDKVYVFGGNGATGSGAEYATEEYAQLTNTWTVKSPAFLSLGYGLAFEVAGKIYIIDSKYVLEYDPGLDQ